LQLAIREATVSGNPEPKTIPELFFKRAGISANAEALVHKQAGRWIPITWREYEQGVRDVARGISDWVQPKDMVCILSENRPEWCFSDLATLSLGGVTAPIYPTNPPKDIAYILNDSGAKLLFLSTAEQLAKIRQLRAENKIPKLERVVVFDEIGAQEDWIITLSQVRKRNAGVPDPIAQRMPALGRDDLATLIYTSGTTGEPKGVMLSHWNIVSNVLSARVLVDQLDISDRQMLSFLPLSHTFERTCGYYLAIHYGFKVAFAESVTKLVDNMGEVHPTLLISVPRIYEKLYSRVMESAQHGLKKKLVFWSLDVGQRHAAYRLAGKAAPGLLNLKNAIAHKLVFSKLHQRLGGRLKYAISGGAPLAKEIANFLNAIGLTVFEGYGLSESSPIITANLPGKMKVGTVGVPFPEVEIKIAPEPDRERDGEILARGPNIMMGYYNKPQATAETVDAEGWLHTGDIGYLDSEGFLHITDRKKELIKTAGGKYVAPQPIENSLKVHGLVEQAVVIGDKRKYCSALIVPAFDALKNALGRDLPADRSQLNDDPQVRSLIQGAVDQVNRDLGSWEQIKRFHLLPAELSQETGELTPSLKMKRRVIEEKYRQQIDSLYPAG
jgi:long-chain acyl-CoA synthetase